MDQIQTTTLSFWQQRIAEQNMASNFSGALQLTDLNDFITPSQV
jgi:hypothetical protein